MEFRILGPLEVEDEGRLLKLGGAKQRAVLALLLLHANDVVPRERLIDELWGGSRPTPRAPPSRCTSRSCASASAVTGSRRVARDTRSTSSPTSSTWSGFEALVAEARRPGAGSRRRRSPSGPQLWQGPASRRARRPPVRPARRLAPGGVALSPPSRSGSRPSSGSAATRELVPELERLVAEHPLRERLRGQLMLALYLSGRQAEALEAYRQGQRLLADELGLEPGEELRRLEKAILAHDPELAAVTPEPRAREVPTGTVTFLFTDIEGSTQLLKQLGDGYGEVLAEHQRHSPRGLRGARGTRG